jgi:hypothetical protein
MFNFRESNAYHVDTRRFGSTARCPRQPRTSQSGLYIWGLQSRIAAGTGRVRDLLVTSPAMRGSASTWKGQTRPIIVDDDTVAAGEAQTHSQQTYSYMCVITQGSAFVQRTMN